MEANFNINPDDNDDLTKFEGCLDSLIPLLVAIAITILVYFIKK